MLVLFLFMDLAFDMKYDGIFFEQHKKLFLIHKMVDKSEHYTIYSDDHEFLIKHIIFVA